MTNPVTRYLYTFFGAAFAAIYLLSTIGASSQAWISPYCVGVTWRCNTTSRAGSAYKSLEWWDRLGHRGQWDRRVQPVLRCQRSRRRRSASPRTGTAPQWVCVPTAYLEAK